MSEEELDLSKLAPEEIPVKGPDGLNYVMRSASADATVRYENASMKTRKWDNVRGEDGKDHIKIIELVNLADVEPFLVSLCLCETEGNQKGRALLKKDGTPVLVPESKIRSWPGASLTPLFELAIRLSPWLRKQEDKKTPDPKALLSPTPDSST